MIMALTAAGLGGFLVGLAQSPQPRSALSGLAHVAALSNVTAGPAQSTTAAGGSL